MARGRRAAAKPLTLGFAGSGELDPKSIIPLLDDYVEGRTIEALYVPVTDADWTDEMAAVVEWAKKNDIPYTTISDEDALKKPELKGVIDDAEDDFEAGESAGKSIVELLAGDENEPVADGRLLLFMNGSEDEDVSVFEEADQLEVPAFDLCNGLKPIQFGDDEDDAPAEDEPAEEEAPEPAPVARGRRKAAVKQEEVVADDDDEDEEPAAGESREELLKLSLVELKKRAKALDPKVHTTETLRGKSKGDIIPLLTGDEAPDEAPDEAQAALSTGRVREAPKAAPEVADEGEGDDPEAETRAAVFARLRGQRETAERISAQVSRISKELVDDAAEGEEFETAAAVLASALMIFADFIVSEIRKPKSPGRPRKDGTEAQPKVEKVEEAPKTRRRSSSS